SVVKVKRAILLDGTDEAGVDHSQRLHHIEVLGKDILLGKGNGELSEVQRLICLLPQLVTISRSQRLAESARNGSLRMDGLASYGFEHLGAEVAHFHHLCGNIRRRLQHADHIADGIVGVRTEQKIGSSQEIEMEDVLFHVGDAVTQLAKLLARGGWIDSKDCIASLGRGKMMRPRTYTANARRDAGEIFHRLSEAKLFEAAQFNHVHPGGVHVTGIIELNGHLGMALNAGDRLNDDCLCHGSPPRHRPQTASARKAVESCGSIRNLFWIKSN